jgi:hypothetical protein
VPVTKSCEQCNEPFRIKPSRAAGRRFCSRLCLFKWQRNRPLNLSLGPACPKCGLQSYRHGVRGGKQYYQCSIPSCRRSFYLRDMTVAEAYTVNRDARLPLKPASEDEEVWLPIPGYEGRYYVSNFGRIRSDVSRLMPGRILKMCVSNTGYFYVRLWKNGREKVHFTHALVAAAFLGPRPVGLLVNHKDGSKLNNRPENLEYVTRSENIQHAFDTGLIKAASGNRHRSRTRPESIPRGEDSPVSKLKQSQVDEIRRRHADGESCVSLAKEFNVAGSQVNRIVLWQQWS